MTHGTRRILASLLLALLLAACATSPTGRRQLMLVPEDMAIQQSAQAYVAMLAPYRKEQKLDPDPEVTQQVRRITDRLVAVAKEMYPRTRDWDWQVHVIDDPETVNAWCMAGGRMAVYSGLLKKVRPTDDELAQVMGHEIAHALANHVAEHMSVAMASAIGATVVGSAIAAKHEHYGLALTGAALAAKLAIELPNNRTQEAEADRIGIELAARAGFDPRAAVTLWEKMAKVSGNGPPEILSTHPAPAHRMEAMRKLVPKMMPIYEQALRRLRKEGKAREGKVGDGGVRRP